MRRSINPTKARARVHNAAPDTYCDVERAIGQACMRPAAHHLRWANTTLDMLMCDDCFNRRQASMRGGAA